MAEKRCAQCGAPIGPGRRPVTKYCDQVCREAAYAERTRRLGPRVHAPQASGAFPALCRFVPHALVADSLDAVTCGACLKKLEEQPGLATELWQEGNGDG